MQTPPRDPRGDRREEQSLPLREPGLTERTRADAPYSRVHALILHVLQARGLPVQVPAQVQVDAQPDTHTSSGRPLEPVPLVAAVHLRVAAALAARTGLPTDTACEPPLIELYSERAELGHPLLNDDHVRLLGLAAPAELRALKALALRTGQALRELGAAARLALDGVRLRLGRSPGGLLLTEVVLTGDLFKPEAEPGPILERLEHLARAPSEAAASDRLVTCELVVRPRAGSSDPQAEAIAEALAAAGFAGVTVDWVGRSLQLTVRADRVESARAQVDAMCRALLCSPLLETYELRTEER
ncbi:MAG: phosphoribosylformylglycinamidine synthase subunit PurS [Polyangia bacterium]